MTTLRGVSVLIESCCRRNSNISRGLPKKLPLAGVKHIILVASGKGGVGKSTVATNLSVALSKRCQVGLLDADVFGPSIPTMMNISGAPEANKQKIILPPINYNIKCMSMGLLVDEGNPIVWRGLMVMQGIKRLLRGVRWGPLDVLVIDMPPGTGDTQLSITQEVPISGVVLVSTPQKVAVIDCIKGAEMFRKVDAPIIGLIENMSYFTCSSCNTKHYPFSQDVSKKLASNADIPILASLPVSDVVSEHCDKGTPSVLLDEEISKVFDSVVDQILKKIDL